MIRQIAFTTTLLIVLLAGCHRPNANVTFIDGTLKDAAGTKLILQEMDIREMNPVDSVIPGENGLFNFKIALKESGFWVIKAQDGKILVLLLNKGDRVSLSGSARDFPDNVIVKGAVEAMLLADFFRHTRKNEKLVDSLEMLLVDQQDSSNYYQLSQKLDTSFKQIWDAQRKYEKEFIASHPGSLASIVVLNYAFGMSPVLSPEEDLQDYRRVDSAMWKQFPENKHVKFHHQRMAEITRDMSHK
jgi:hypothetical protein